VIVHQIGTGNLTISSAISGGAGALTKDGSGTLTLTGTQDYATLTATAGVTNLQVPLGNGTSTIHANARMNITTSQTLAALNIGPTGVVALGTSSPAPLEKR
jgi:autotransporter-associated beta strand protein